MRATKISPDQKIQILEMCKYLFPEYKNIRFGKDWRDSEVQFDNLPNAFPDPREMHWFELCMLDLPERLHTSLRMKRDRLDPDSEKYYEIEPDFQDGTEILNMFVWKRIHPVDHLYKEFKKLANG